MIFMQISSIQVSLLGYKSSKNTNITSHLEFFSLHKIEWNSAPEKVELMARKNQGWMNIDFYLLRNVYSNFLLKFVNDYLILLVADNLYIANRGR